MAWSRLYLCISKSVLSFAKRGRSPILFLHTVRDPISLSLIGSLFTFSIKNRKLAPFLHKPPLSKNQLVLHVPRNTIFCNSIQFLCVCKEPKVTQDHTQAGILHVLFFQLFEINNLKKMQQKPYCRPIPGILVTLRNKNRGVHPWMCPQCPNFNIFSEITAFDV